MSLFNKAVSSYLCNTEFPLSIFNLNYCQYGKNKLKNLHKYAKRLFKNLTVAFLRKNCCCQPLLKKYLYINLVWLSFTLKYTTVYGWAVASMGNYTYIQSYPAYMCFVIVFPILLYIEYFNIVSRIFRYPFPCSSRISRHYLTVDYYSISSFSSSLFLSIILFHYHSFSIILLLHTIKHCVCPAVLSPSHLYHEVVDDKEN